MKEKLNHASVELEMSFGEMKPIENTGFVRGVCKIAYAGKNRNYSNISKEAFESAEKSLYGIPVVGNWLEKEGNFGGHDVLFETKGNKCVIKDTTIPYGFVPQDANPRWEAVEDEYGNIKNYYTADVILWKERFPEQVEFIEKKKINQSMEISVLDGDWDNRYEYFDIDEFQFSALCLLGRDRDGDVKGENDVEPCFEDADVSIGNFGLSKEFKAELHNMKEIYQSIGKEEMLDMKKDKFEDESVADVDVKDEPVADEVDNVEPSDDSQEEQPEDIQDESDEQEESDESQEPSDAEVELNSLRSQNEALQKEVDELKEFRQQVLAERAEAEKQEIVKEFSILLSEDEMLEIADSMESFSVEEVRAKFACAVAEKALNEAKASTSKAKKDEAIVFDNKNNTNKELVKDKFAII